VTNDEEVSDVGEN